jgi:hypothetical protein
MKERGVQFNIYFSSFEKCLAPEMGLILFSTYFSSKRDVFLTPCQIPNT